MRHDISGRYPTSAPDFRQEQPIVRAMRKPCEDPEDILHRWFAISCVNTPDDEDEDEGEEDE